VAVFDLFNFPLGTLLAAYTFYVLLQNSASAYFAGTTTSLTTTS